MLSRHNLHNYQNRGVDFVCKTEKCALWLDLGLGKTVTSLTSIADLIDSMTVSRVLVIAPLRVANTVWEQEAANWSHLRHLKFSICTGSEKSRIASLNKTADVYVINRENVKWLVEFYKRKWQFDMVVIDESSSFKSSGSQRFKALRKVTDMIERMVQLTGTPSSNGLLDLWAQIALLDGGARLGKNMTRYKEFYFESDYMGYKWTPKEGSDQKIQDKISDIVMTMRASDYLELKDPIIVKESVSLPAKVKAQYDELEKEFLIELDDEEVSVVSAAALANKLLQLCNGAIYTDDKGSYAELHKKKIDTLAEIVEENPGENILVAYNYKSDLARLKKKFPGAVVLDKKGEAVEHWNRGEIKMLLAHPASASMGLNLQKGGSMIVWFGLTWSLEFYQQFNGRLHRQGQTKPVRIIHLVAKGCIDERVLEAIANKAKTQDDLLNALKV